jgi:hypothetical protein
MAKKPIDFSAERDKRDAHQYRLAQAQTMIDHFAKARGREPTSTDELVTFIRDEEAAGGGLQTPIKPTKEAYRKVVQEGKKRR